MDNASQRVREAVMQTVAVYVATRIGLWFATRIGLLLTRATSMSALLTGWDGQHFMAIAANGYPKHVDAHTYALPAFLPGMPILTRAIGTVLPMSINWTGILMANVAGGVFVVYATKLAAQVWDSDAAKKAGMLLAVFPGAFVLSLPYAESLALAAAAAAFYYLGKRKDITAGLLGALATFTSPVTLPLVLSFAWSLWCGAQQSDDKKSIVRLAAALCLTPLGFVAYMLYLWSHSGSITLWWQIEKNGFRHHIALSNYVHLLQHGSDELRTLVLLTTAVFVASVVAAWRVRLPFKLWLFAGCIMFTAVFDQALTMQPRFLLNAFPFLLALGAYGAKRNWCMPLLTAFTALLPLTFLAYMTLGNYTAQP
jgi:hypothetical protein